MKKKIWIFVGGGLLLVLLVVANLSSREKLTEVRADEVTLGPLAELVNASGKLEPKTSVDISATIMGKITRLEVEEGDYVSAGQFLLEIDPEEYRSMVRAYEAGLESAREDLALAEANLEMADLDLQRQQRLRDQGLRAPTPTMPRLPIRRSSARRWPRPRRASVKRRRICPRCVMTSARSRCTHRSRASSLD